MTGCEEVRCLDEKRETCLNTTFAELAIVRSSKDVQRREEISMQVYILGWKASKRLQPYVN